MAQVWELAGYDVQQLLGFGSTGEVWRAVHRASGDVVALKRLREGADPARLRREAAVLARLDTPHVVRLRELVDDGGCPVLVLDHAAGGSLASLLTRRGRLLPGEVVTVAVALADALAVAHASGIVHGDLSPANVLFTATGMPLLSDLGVARSVDDASRGDVQGTAEYVEPVVAAGGAPTCASDVWALGALCHQALAGCAPHEGESAAEVLALVTAGDRAPLGLLAAEAPRTLVSVVESALHADPSQRPTAAALATALRRACPAEPVALVGTVALPVSRRPTHVVPRPASADPERPAAETRRRLVPRQVVVALLAGSLLVLAGAAGWASARDASGAASLPSVATGPAAAADWRQVVDDLDAARARAFAAGRPALLADVHVAGSPSLSADTALLSGIAGRGERVQGVRHELVSVAEVRRDASRVLLRVVDVLAAHRVLAADGRVLLERAESGPVSRLLTLAWSEGAWRVAEVAPG